MYSIKRWSLNSPLEEKITQKEYVELKNAKETLSSGLAMEEKYEILISNYLDFEKECLNQMTDYMMRSDFIYERSFQTRLTLNTRFVNLLTSARLYVDQIRQHVGACAEDSEFAKTEIKTLMASMYDSIFEYRFMEAIRNFVQHRGLAIHKISYNGKWTSINEPDSELEYRILISAMKSKLSGDSAFKKGVYNDMPDEVNISEATRVYIAALNQIHSRARELTNQNLTIARSMISDVIDKYKPAKEEDNFGIEAIHFTNGTETLEVLERLPLMLEWDDMRLALYKKNKNISNLRKWVVTSSLNH
ncbi:hypothetical protein [Bowmanella sp. JS7-9]|uniref:Uncharacterized protein n=1 Tax=Pseudobowmanella zhangzhouensis TaxID=1537679 RepID=A0ABW1XRW7_9ALTE|nr:hypothetical protein [Bowmanella sp. JS7-9]TBX23671.1 hypothetical protein TK45_06055 [Bowmanella sp. JS7-9]